jgi:DNA-binding XRE family transcriptional regulator
VEARRGELGMTRQGLADAAGVDLKTIYNLESGTRWPIAKTRVAVAVALGWAPDTLSVVAEGSAPQQSSASMRLVGEASTPEQRAPFAWQIEREVEEAERRYGPDPTGEQIFGPGHEADAWNAPTWDRDETVQMLALFRWFAFRNVGGQSGSKTGLTLAPAGYT